MEKTSKLARYLVPALVLLAGVCFVILGVFRNESTAVLKKAINICMECIGLG